MNDVIAEDSDEDFRIALNVVSPNDGVVMGSNESRVFIADDDSKMYCVIIFYITECITIWKRMLYYFWNANFALIIVNFALIIYMHD